VTARLFAQKLGMHLGQPMVVENRPGASGSIAAAEVARSEPDGYRLLMIASGTLFHSAVGGKVPYNIERDFTPIAMATIGPLVLMVGPSVTARTVPELIAYARANPGKLTFGTDGVGATAHLAGEMFNLMAEVKTVHVPFKGAGEATVAVASGQVDMGFPSLASAQPLLQAGKGRALAVSTLQRSSLLNNVPTLDEAGLKGYDLAGWFALIGPARMPRAKVDKIGAAVAAVGNMPDVKDSLARLGLEASVMSPEQLASYFRQQSATVAKVARGASIKLE
jgi:tripartite-type tricarboxylate transporter receptor subunit TctC